jgi:hypothetical protein
MVKPLLFDVTRCTAQLDYSELCAARNTCARFLTWSEWDKGRIPEYRAVPIMPARRNCHLKIEGKA